MESSSEVESTAGEDRDDKTVVVGGGLTTTEGSDISVSESSGWLGINLSDVVTESSSKTGK